MFSKFKKTIKILIENIYKLHFTDRNKIINEVLLNYNFAASR